MNIYNSKRKTWTNSVHLPKIAPGDEMNGGRFKIMDAVIQAYGFVGREAGYLAKILFLPLAAQMVTTIYIQMARPEAGTIEIFLWKFPALVLLGWYMFLEARLILFGERLDRMTREQIWSSERKRAMRAAVIVALLFNMALTALQAFMEFTLKNNPGGSKGLWSLGFMLAVGAYFWGLRFGVMHIVVTLGQSIRQFIFIVNGIEFSLRLAGMFMLCILPVTFAGGFILSVLIDNFPFIKEPTVAQIYTILIADAIMSAIVVTLANAAAAFAVREILLRAEGRTPA